MRRMLSISSDNGDADGTSGLRNVRPRYDVVRSMALSSDGGGGVPCRALVGLLFSRSKILIELPTRCHIGLRLLEHPLGILRLTFTQHLEAILHVHVSTHGNLRRR